jgi:hypothetical protein
MGSPQNASVGDNGAANGRTTTKSRSIAATATTACARFSTMAKANST